MFQHRLVISLGEYCDIISECKQKITISGGKGFFKPHNSDEPVGRSILNYLPLITEQQTG
jgi:CII-binding regulator of phage lambda lysogenization HflD